jgi:5-methylcytosine-specific restriction protein A
MPKAALRPCAHPGCTELVRSARCARHARQQYRTHNRYYRDPAVQKMYNSKRWKKIRKEHLEAYPYCANHLRQGVYVLATQVHHKVPHEGDPIKFFEGELESLCDGCHTAETNKERAYGPQGGQKSFEK